MRRVFGDVGDEGDGVFGGEQEFGVVGDADGDALAEPVNGGDGAVGDGPAHEAGGNAERVGRGDVTVRVRHVEQTNQYGDADPTVAAEREHGDDVEYRGEQPHFELRFVRHIVELPSIAW